MSKKFLSALFSLCAPLRVLLCLFLFTGVSSAYTGGQFLTGTYAQNPFGGFALGPNNVLYGGYSTLTDASSSFLKIATYNGSSWTELTSIPESLVSSNFSPLDRIASWSPEAMAVDTSGNIHVVVAAGARVGGAAGPRGIFYGKYTASNQTWALRKLFISGSSSYSVANGEYAMKLDANQNPHVVFRWRYTASSPNTATIGYAYYNGTSWNVTGANTALDGIVIDTVSGTPEVAWPDIAFDASGNMHVAYLKEQSNGISRDIMYTMKAAGGNTFTTPVMVMNAGNASRPSIALDSAGKVWIGDSYFSGMVVNYRLTNNSSGSWASNTVASYTVTTAGATAECSFPILKMNAAGRKVMTMSVWGTNSGNPQAGGHMRVAYETSPGVWAQEAMISNLSDSYIQNPSMFLQPNNSVMVSYGKSLIASPFTRTFLFADGIPTGYGAPANPNLTINDVTLNEGNTGTTSFTFTASLSAAAPAGGVTFNYATANNTATAGSDYTAATGTGTIAAGQTSTTITVLANGDTTVEPDETFFVNLSAATNATITDAQGLGTITNDDTSIALTLPDSSLFEDQVIDFAFTFTRSGNVSGSATANFSYGGTAALTTDYTQTGATTFGSGNGTVTFGPGETSKIITINPVADNLVEGSETVGLSLNGGTGYNVTGTATQNATIVDDDVNVSVTVSPASVTEDGVSQLVYTFTRSGGPTSNPLVANVNVSGTATPNVDYTSSGFTSFNSGTGEGTVTFATGSATRIVTIFPSPDSTVEPDETVILTLAANGTPAVTGGYTVGTPGTATGTIVDDDTLVAIQSISTTSLAENSGTNIVYTFSRTGPTTAALTANLDVQGSAKFNVDYTQSGATTFTTTGGTITFPVGSSTTTVTLTVVDDEIVESNETLFLDVLAGTGYSPNGGANTVTITDNDTATLTLAKINDGNEQGPVPALFRFSLSAPASSAVTINYNFLGSATSGDYTSPGSAVTIAAGETSADVSVPIVDDSIAEGTETLTLNVMSVMLPSIAITADLPMFATADIIDNDRAVSIAADAAFLAEGTGSGTTAFGFTVARVGPTTGAVNVNYTVTGSGGNPANAADFGGSFPTGSVTIPAGAVSVPLVVNVSKDSVRESHEGFTVTLSGPDNDYVLGTATASSTISNDDFEADLSIANTDGVTTATPGGSVTYTITVSNAGPDPVTGATVADTFPAALTANWSAVGAGGGTVASSSGSGNINTTVNLPAGASVTFTASATINASATGTLSNTATVTAPAGTTDPTPGNNSATDTDTLNPSANLAITVTDGVTTAAPGANVTYTITVSNAGPSNAPGATVADTFPASLTANWTSVTTGGASATAAGSGNINDTVNLPSGSTIVYTVIATISPSATGTLSNTATVTAPAGVTDPSSANNSATDTDTLAPVANLAITITDGVTTATPGGTVTYTITASNTGPSNAPGATVACTFPASLTTTWIGVGAGGGTATAAGSGNINDTVNLPAGGSVTYMVTATISPSATNSLSATATVTAPGGVTDLNPANNSGTDTDTLNPTADLAITVTDGATSVSADGNVTYTIVVSNAGPSNSPATGVFDMFPAALTSVNWTAVGAGGSSGFLTSGTGDIVDMFLLPAGGSVTYTVNATVSASATGTLSNTATVAPPLSVTDPTPGNNSATDTTTIISGTIGDRVWYDVDGDGVQDSNEVGITGVNMQLMDNASNLLASTTTGENGAYSFNGLSAGTYRVRVWSSPTRGLSIATTPLVVVVNLAEGEVRSDVDFGHNAIGSAVHAVWADLNGDKIMDANEPGISGVLVYHRWAGQNGIFNDSDDLVRQVPMTSQPGEYLATGVATGRYQVWVDPASLPPGAVPSFDADGTATPNIVTYYEITAAEVPARNAKFGYLVNDLSITATDGVATALAGNQITYTITASNSIGSPSTANGVIIEDTFAAALTNVSWTAATSGGASTASLSGTGNLNQTVNLPAGGSITYTVTATINGIFSGNIENTATLTAPVGFNDYIPGNNSATDSVTVSLQADLTVTLTDAPDPVQANENITYTLTVTNQGPSTASDIHFQVTLPNGVTFVSINPVSGWNVTTPEPGISSEIIGSRPSLPAGSSVFTIVAKVGYVGNGTVLNASASVMAALGDVTDSNNNATATTTVSAAPEIALHNGGSTVDAPITDGQVTAISFGTTTVNTPVTRSFTIANTGNDILSLTAITVPSGFSLVNPFNPPVQGFILPQSSYTFQVRYDAGSIGTASGEIVIGNNDADEAPFNFPITATRENVAPVAVLQDLTIEEDEVKPIVLTGNDADDHPLTFAIVDAPQHGTLTGTPPNVIYTPNADYYGDDVFTFTVNDGTTDSTEVEINLTITPVNDAPKVVGTGIPDQIQIRPDVSRTIDLAPYFSDAETASASLTYTVVAPAEAQAVVIGSSLQINGSVAGAFDITVTAADPDALNVGDTFTLIVKRVPQLAGNGVPPTLVSPSEPTFDLDLAGYFIDGDGDALGYAITNNTDSGVLTATISGSTVTITPVTPGVASLTIRVTDSDGNFIDHTFEVTIDDPIPDAIPTVTSPPKLNRQTGLYEITLTATNNNQFNVPGFRFRVTSVLPTGTRLYNSTAAPGSSEAYLDVLTVLTPGQSITVVLEFYSATRNFTGFEPTIIAEPLPEGTNNAGTGEGMAVNRFVNLPDGSKLIEFSSIAGRWYEIEYSSDMVTWKRSLVPVQAGANFTQWIDRGAPYTESHPSTVPSRFYRVSEILPD